MKSASLFDVCRSHTNEVYQTFLQVESFILEQDELEDGEPVLDTSQFLLSPENIEGTDLRNVDPETQARLEALLEAAGKYLAYSGQ